MDYQALQEEIARHFEQIQAMAELEGLDRNIAACLDNATSYLEGALEIAKEKNSPLPPLLFPRAKSKRLGMYRWQLAVTTPEKAMDLILALEDSQQPIAGE
ncbi:MAG: hypothetical protein J7647_10385 [Cyanobacteria bacterium SBLK]|nr:hypothetical protein [Cyanobacteria bacterium SBLK]